MLTQQEAADLRQFVDAVKQGLRGYRESEQQREMIAAVAETFDRCLHGCATAETDGANILACESGTGTGKTFAYAIPGLVLARSVGKRLVISSSTVALQEQLAAKDLPFLQSCAPWPFSVAIAKGRGRYMCNVRLTLALETVRQGRLDDDDHGDTRCASEAAVLRRLGERSTLAWRVGCIKGRGHRGDAPRRTMSSSDDGFRSPSCRCSSLLPCVVHRRANGISRVHPALTAGQLALPFTHNSHACARSLSE